MSQVPASETDTPVQDRIAWHQIFVGYGLVLMMLLLSVLFQLGFAEDRDMLRNIGTAAVVVAVGGATVLKYPLGAFRRRVLVERPALENRLQWAAIIFLMLLSAATSVHGIMVLPASGWSAP
ncbi:hypothetical protein [Agrobacterium larrymoorei]|uniref:hypothetical protein n=1 Tax=Agrobacterium larrymoorei TaxID=160699 RepID=UPI0030BFBD6D